MSDEADLAAQQEHLALQAALSVRRRVGPPLTGFCANCGEELQAPRRWCNPECREDWQMREKI